jgi:hypothetical protein
MRSAATFLFAFILAANLSCSVNILENFADKTTNDALLVDAKKLMSEGDYAGALAKIDAMTDSFEAGRAVVALKAQAHAGICGLDFFNFVLALKDLGTQRVLPFLLSSFRSGADTAKLDHCITAETLIKSIGAAGARTTDENLLMLLVSFTKIGTLLSLYADSDQDGTATAAYDVCTAGAPGARTAGGAMPDEDARELGTGLTIALESLGAVGSSIDLGSGSLDAFSNACGSLPPGYDFCSKTEGADFTANELKGIRSLTREGSALGLDLNGCGGGDVTTPGCQCP